jgi:hypothetical protein
MLALTGLWTVSVPQLDWLSNYTEAMGGSQEDSSEGFPLSLSGVMSACPFMASNICVNGMAHEMERNTEKYTGRGSTTAQELCGVCCSWYYFPQTY